MITLSILILTGCFGLPRLESNVHTESQTGRSSVALAEYVPHAPITISNNTDLISQSWPGNGSVSNPYRIEGFEIISVGGSCISIEDTSLHILVSSCQLTSSGPYTGRGVALQNVSNCVIDSCQITSLNEGVDIRLCDQGTNSITNNQILNNLDTGIDVNGVIDGIVIANNTVTNSEYGITLFHVFACTVTNNSLVNNGFAMSNNVFWTSRTGLFQDNSVNGRPLGIIEHVTNADIDVDSYGQLFLAHCQNVTVRGGAFHNASIGVTLDNSINCTVSGTISYWNTYGIGVYASDNCTIEGTSLYENHRSGVFTSSTLGIVIHNNDIIENNHYPWNEYWEEHGLHLLNSHYASIYNNTLYQNTVGILLWDVSQSDIVNNTFSDNYEYGLSLNADSHNNTVYENCFLRNSPNAEDNGYDNTWDNGVSEGNYWSDYDGVGYYEISGSAGSVDRHPTGPPITTTTPTTTTSPTTTGTGTTSTTTGTTRDGDGEPLSLGILIAIGGGAAVVIILIIFSKRRTRI